nr:immunoglobulin light chain junction region [Macaca mulatta]
DYYCQVWDSSTKNIFF